MFDGAGEGGSCSWTFKRDFDEIAVDAGAVLGAATAMEIRGLTHRELDGWSHVQLPHTYAGKVDL